MKWYIAVLKKYAVFHGRAQRKEYWMFFLVNIIVAVVLVAIEGILGIAGETNQSVLATIYELAILIPTIAVGVRRMHDTDHSGWWLLFPIVNLALAISEGQQGANRFGPDPKATSPNADNLEVGTRSISSTDSTFVVCSRCGFEQWKGYKVCQKCGIAFQ